ncbi:MAG: NifU family protein [Actinomycetota bacterium]|jgi:Fe-S cluster biogenesis protein NfuA|nr:NifU family protein [Actinomycetota bacterium]
MSELDALLDRLEEVLAAVEALDDSVRPLVFELLDGVDALHRTALRSLAAAIDDDDALARLRAAHPAIEWLFDAYAVGIDERAAADAALEEVRPYIHSHGGRVEVVDAAEGVVRLRLAGSCSGCTASDVTVTESIEEALRDRWPGFVALEVEADDAPAHPPPTTSLVQIGGRPPGL